MQDLDTQTVQVVSSTEFKRRFRWLIILTWNLPPVVGLGFILLTGILTPAQLIGILTTPLEPAYIILWSVFGIWFFPRLMRPLIESLSGKSEIEKEKVLQSVRAFPLWYWSLFLVYLVLAPISVVVAAELYTDFVYTPLALFRIELIAVIVSIIVGLPIFFLIMDLFGQSVGGLLSQRPIVTVKTKVFLIGALIPLLIDTMLVQYFWTRTGHFTSETFFVWLILELLAIGGSLIFAHSFGQSLMPLQGVISGTKQLWQYSPKDVHASSTDELGVLTNGFRDMLAESQIHSRVLEINNKVLRGGMESSTLESLSTTVIDTCDTIVPSDIVFLMLYDEPSRQLVGVMQSGMEFNAEGYYRLGLDDTSMAVFAFNQAETVAIDDVDKDDRVSRELSERFNISSAIATPLQFQDKMLGVLMSVTQQRKHKYTHYENELFEALARETAVAINTQLLEETKQTQGEQLALLLDATEEGVYGVDLNGICTFVNAACVRMLGFAHEKEILGASIHELIHHSHPDGSHYPKEQCQVRLATLDDKSAHRVDEVHWRKDGSSFPVEYWSHPLKRDGETIGTVVTFIDITERKKNEAELSDYRENLEQLVEDRTAILRQQAQVIDQIHDSVVATDMDGVVTSWNRGAERLFGYQAEEAIGQHISIVYPENQHAFLQDEVIKPLLDKENFEIEVVMHKKSGLEFDAHLSLSLLKNEQGVANGMVGYSLDITQRKRYEKLLVEAKQEADAANNAKTEFLSRMSHELRTPLNAVLGFAHILGMQLEGNQLAKSHTKEITNAGNHLLTLIEEIMDLSRIDAGQMAMHPELVNLGEVIGEAVLFITPQAEQQGINIEISGCDQQLMADVTRLKEVMLNLLSNAVKYNKPGGRIMVSCSQQDDYIQISVADTGIGFSEEQKTMLFEPFSRLGAEFTGIQGTGIGMTIVKQLVELMGGTITVESQVGQGSCFNILLPDVESKTNQ